MVSFVFSQPALQNWLRPERSVQLARVANIVLVVWLAWLLADLGWQLFPQPESGEQAPAARVGGGAPIKRGAARIDEQQIAAWHIFGVAGADKPVAQAATLDAPDTSLKLTLRGVFASEDPQQARAIIGDPRGQEEHYSVGGTLPGNASLKEIYPDRIILERNGRYETLRLPRELTNHAGGVTDWRQRASRQQLDGVSGIDTVARPGKVAAPLKKASSLLSYARLTAQRSQGRLLGYRLDPASPSFALEDLGLQAGDIVTAINGVQIDAPAELMQTMRQSGGGDSLNVTLLRNGQELSVSLLLPSSSD